jgi:glutamate-1-semialdehyde 2,1-aminomutase
MGTLSDLLKSAGFKAQVLGEPPLFDLMFTERPIRDYRDTLHADVDTLRRFNQLLRARGIMKGESKYYVSLAHTPEDVRHTIATWKDALRELKA